MSIVSTLPKRSFTDITLPWHTLRFHSKRVTTLSIQPTFTDSTLPYLISGDEEGKLVVWGLLTRRPLTVIQLPTHAQIIDAKPLWHMGKVLYCVLSRDHTFRVYVSDGSNAKVAFEMPVNTLNFANFEAWSEDGEITLVCCSTIGAEFIDVYRFRVGELNSLRRLFKGVDFQPLLSELLTDEGSGEERKLGIAMRFARDCLHGVVFCGFEGGIVLGFKLLPDSIEIVYVSEYYYPNPILDLFVGYGESVVLLSSSTSREINLVGLDKYMDTFTLQSQKGLDHTDETPHSGDFPPQATTGGTKLAIAPNVVVMKRETESRTIKSPFPKVSHVRATKNFYVLSGWSGRTAVLDKTDLKLVDTYWKSRSGVSVNESARGSLGNEKVREPQYRKIGAMTVLDPFESQLNSAMGYTPSPSASSNSESSLTSDSLIAPRATISRRRLDNLAEHTWCFVGYDDGSIGMYKVS